MAFSLTMRVQLFGEGHQVNGLLALVQRHHLLKDAPMMVVEEIFGTQLFDGHVNGVVVHQDGAEDAAFGVQILGQRAFENGLRGHLISLFALVSPQAAAQFKRFFRARSPRTCSCLLGIRDARALWERLRRGSITRGLWKFE